ncbi:ABC transporter ATP-binding protein [Tissierella creatinini]|nr:ABC transporter ATP-binding protein [Tissierella creatinini]TJX63969.1 ABC transporter ATP-binding protein [Soehngenia saccharolytica]
MENLLEVKNLNTYFYTQNGVVKAVRDVSFSLEKKEILGVVGESGSGKSVMCKSIMGLVENPGRIVDGEIIYKGTQLQGLRDNEMRKLRGRDIAYLMQNPMSAFNPMHNVEKHIVDSILIHEKISKKEAVNRAIELLDKMGIVEAEKNSKKYPHQFSGGMLQRAAIAMAIACNPQILIADEPTTALDLNIQAQILKLLKELREKLDMSILVITHNFGVIWDICDRVNVMYAGNIVESASVKNIYKNPLHPYTRALLGSIITMEMDKNSILPTLQGTVIDMKEINDGCDFASRCPYVTEECKTNCPKLIEIEKGHFVQCHFVSKRN